MINKYTMFLTNSSHFGTKSTAFKIYWKEKYCKIIQKNTLEPHVKNQCFGSLIIPFSAFWSTCVHCTWLHNLILKVIILVQADMLICLSGILMRYYFSKWAFYSNIVCNASHQYNVVTYFLYDLSCYVNCRFSMVFE